MDGISGKRALVTGGSAGIGLGIALKLVEMGATVFIIGRNKEKLDKTVFESGNKIVALQVDVGSWSATREVVKDILPIQLLINNAATFIMKPVLRYTEEDYDSIMNVNLKGVINLTQFVTEDLISRDMGGRVVNISSISSSRVFMYYMIYNASKAALDMVTKSFASELGSHKIRVNAVNPTAVLTEMGKVAMSDSKRTAELISRTPQGRVAEVEEIVNATIFLLSDKSDMINGHCLPVDGGYLTG